MSSSLPTTCDELIDEIWKEIFVDGPFAGGRFISQNRLKQSLTRQRTEALLRCRCGTCIKHNGETPLVDEERLRDWVIGAAPKLFSLLGYSGCPQFIRSFFRLRYQDTTIEKDIQYLDQEFITREICSPKFQRLAERIEENRHKFFVPTLHDRVTRSADIQVFGAETILPFTRQEKIGHGAFSNVYAFELLEEYQNFEGLNTNVSLVRKEIDEEDVFPDELPILLHVRNLNNKHIVRLITAYKHGSKLNLVFPQAARNLHTFLREPIAPVNGASINYIDRHPIWKQMLAVIEVLYQIYAESYHASSGEQIKLYHFDLKPANILVNTAQDGLTFLVSDFGLSRAQHAVDQVGLMSRVSGCPGTAAYAPPEINRSDFRWNHRYDVWSLGCILLEICAYVVDGPHGVKVFEDSKFTQLPGSRTIRDDNLWHTAHDGQLQIKPTVLEWAQRLPKTSNAGDSVSSNFLSSVLGLAIEMLDVNCNGRLDAEAAYNRLESILRNVERPESSDSSYILAEFVHFSHQDEIADLAGSVPVGLAELQQCKTVNCRFRNKQYEGVKVHLYEDDQSVMRLRLMLDSAEILIIELGPRKSLSLIPSPATGNRTQNRLVIHLESIKDHRANSVRINLASVKDTTTLQSVLTGQAVRSISNAGQKSLGVEDLRVQPSLARIKFRMISKGKPKSLFHLHGASNALQFWTEKTYVNPDEIAKIRPRRGSPRFVFDVPKRRLVLYCEKALVTIRIGKNMRLKKGISTDGGWSHQLVPTDASSKSNDPSFGVSVLTSAYKGSITAPLDRENLLEAEESAMHDCSLVKLGFSSEQDWKSFAQRYQILKEEWRREHDHIQQLIEKGAEARGWAPSTPAV